MHAPCQAITLAIHCPLASPLPVRRVPQRAAAAQLLPLHIRLPLALTPSISQMARWQVAVLLSLACVLYRLMLQPPVQAPMLINVPIRQAIYTLARLTRAII